jgi:hypothetical protein
MRVEICVFASMFDYSYISSSESVLIDVLELDEIETDKGLLVSFTRIK